MPRLGLFSSASVLPRLMVIASASFLLPRLDRLDVETSSFRTSKLRNLHYVKRS